MKRQYLLVYICSLLFLLNPYTVSAEPIIDIRLFVYENNSVIEDKISLTDGRPTQYYQIGDYNLNVYDNNEILWWNQSLSFGFGVYDGPIELGEDYSEIYYDHNYLSFRIPYDSSVYELRLYHDENIIFSKILNFCNNNGICDSSETYESCPADCPLSNNDIICIPDSDGVCDPDCGKDIDPDCVEEFYPDAGSDKETFLGEEVSFHGEVINPGVGTYTYEWFFEDDGSKETGQDVTHSFEEEGVYAVKLTATNQDDISKTDTLLVTIEVTPWHLKKLSLKRLEAARADKKCPKWFWWWSSKKCRNEHRLDKAIYHLEKSLNRKYWIDDHTLDPKFGHKVFNYEKEAVKELMKIEK